MTLLETAVRTSAGRTSRPRHYLMCAPTYFTVSYTINPWMDPSVAVDQELAMRQWESLRGIYQGLGHRVDVVEGDPTLPDMVFAANGGLTIGSRCYGARFRFPERAPEAAVYAAWLRSAGVEVVTPTHTNEGEGDYLALGGLVLAGTGFRTSPAAHAEAMTTLGRPVVSLELVDPRFYHLDTALAVLDDGNGESPADVAYFPEAFSLRSRRVLRELFPDAVLCEETDALVLGLNAVSDGHHVVLPAAATRLAARLEQRGYVPVLVDLGELLKSGGSVKCCTMELHR